MRDLYDEFELRNAQRFLGIYKQAMKHNRRRAMKIVDRRMLKRSRRIIKSLVDPALIFWRTTYDDGVFLREFFFLSCSSEKEVWSFIRRNGFDEEVHGMEPVISKVYDNRYCLRFHWNLEM